MFWRSEIEASAEPCSLTALRESFWASSSCRCLLGLLGGQWLVDASCHSRGWFLHVSSHRPFSVHVCVQTSPSCSHIGLGPLDYLSKDQILNKVTFWVTGGWTSTYLFGEHSLTHSHVSNHYHFPASKQHIRFCMYSVLCKLIRHRDAMPLAVFVDKRYGRKIYIISRMHPHCPALNYSLVLSEMVTCWPFYGTVTFCTYLY